MTEWIIRMNGNKLSNTMNLPQDLQHFPHAALIIASDSMHAKFFLVGGDTLQELDGVALPREFRQDSEGALHRPTARESQALILI